MIHILIGHRGVGKTHLLKQIELWFKKHNKPGLFFDLDLEIERASQKTIPELFQKGSAYFRQWEKKVFKKITSSIKKDQTCFLSVGAGFVFKKKAGWNVIYLLRESDKEGRLFFNRPPLTKLSGLKEWDKLYKKRSLYYLSQADHCFYKREYFKQLEDSDQLFLGLKELNKPAFSYRLYPKLLPTSQKDLKKFLEARLKRGVRFFELNDADCSLKFIQKIQKLAPPEKILFASQQGKKFFSVKNKKHWSWDLSLGKAPEEADILSVHNRNSQPLSSLLKELSQFKPSQSKQPHIKLAVEIDNLKELQLAYSWWKKDPLNRSFLPRSSNGKWLWFRQVFGPFMLLHFIKEHPLAFTNHQEVLDQPHLSEALPFLSIKKPLRLAGIIANPVKNLATPGEQSSFFYKKYSIPVLALNLEEKDLNPANLKILSAFGFVFFAVSSPLKKRAFLCADQTDALSKKLQSSNTLIFENQKWTAFNTDWEGLKSLKKYNLPSTVVWGGGGVRPVLKKLLPKARFYSARKAQPLPSRQKSNSSAPKTLIWAVGRKRMKEGCLWPPKIWLCSQVIDINYTEDSPGLEYALKIKAKYKNGWSFFKKQAKKQRELFQKSRLEQQLRNC